MKNFNQLDLPDFIVNSLDHMGITTPTPVQERSIPLALKGVDILASSQTGSGKTIAYMAPLIAKLMEEKQLNALILVPTRELASQVNETFTKLMFKNQDLRSAILIGGDPMHKQLAQLAKRPRVIIGTPGRIKDHLERRSLKLNHTKFLVLDETDKMLNMGFSAQLEEIVEFLPEERQTLMFSATLPKNIIKLSEKYLNNHEHISIGSSSKPVAHIKQNVLYTEQSEKYKNLVKELEEREGSIIVFMNTKRHSETIAKKLKIGGHNVDFIHGDLKQRKRESVLNNFRKSRIRIIIATDIAARGIDVPHVRHVINYDLPQCAEDYIHRIGRTARAGSEGEALSLLLKDEASKWKLIQRMMDKGIESSEVKLDGGKRKSRPKNHRGSIKSVANDSRKQDNRRFGNRKFRSDNDQKPGKSNFARFPRRSNG